MVHNRRPDTAARPLRRPAATVALALAACLALVGCTARMDMEIKPSGTFDAVIEMRDTSGTVFTAEPDCSQYSSPEALGVTDPGQAKVSAEPLTGQDGSGCLVTVSDVPVADPAQAGATGTGAPGNPEEASPLVRHEGELYVVTLPPLFAPEDEPGGPEPSPDPSPAGQPAAPPGPGGESAQPSPESLSGLVDAQVRITFPGAVVDGGGGQVDGRTVTWTDPDVISDGVQASGMASPGQGLSLWDRHKNAITAALVVGALVAGALAWRKRSQQQRPAPRKRRRPSHRPQNRRKNR